MHILATSSASLDDIVVPVDLGQPPGDIALLSFADSDLAGLATAWAAERDKLPSVRLAQLRDLKHPMSVDLWIERVGAHAKVIVVRLLGGLDWWRYGVERLSAVAGERGVALALLPGVRLAQLRDLKHPMSVDLWIERVGAHAKVIVVRLLGGLDWWRYGVERLSAVARERGIALALLPGEDRDDPRLAEASTLPADELAALLQFFREGGQANLIALLRRLAPPPR